MPSVKKNKKKVRSDKTWRFLRYCFFIFFIVTCAHSYTRIFILSQRHPCLTREEGKNSGLVRRKCARAQIGDEAHWVDGRGTIWLLRGLKKLIQGMASVRATRASEGPMRWRSCGSNSANVLPAMVLKPRLSAS
jgi:hypothetical protein